MEPSLAHILEAVSSLGDELKELHSKRAEADEKAALLHAEHHAWVQAQIQRDQAKAAFWANLADKSVPTIFAALSLAALGGLWAVIKAHINWS